MCCEPGIILIKAEIARKRNVNPLAGEKRPVISRQTDFYNGPGNLVKDFLYIKNNFSAVYK